MGREASLLSCAVKSGRVDVVVDAARAKEQRIVVVFMGLVVGVFGADDR